MRKFYLAMIGPALLLGGTSCIHNHASGSVLHVEADGAAHVCLDASSVDLGDKVKIYDVECTNGRAGNARKVRYGVCKRVFLGEATVTEIGDEHFSMIIPVGGIALKVGQVVEKK